MGYKQMFDVVKFARSSNYACDLQSIFD